MKNDEEKMEFISVWQLLSNSGISTEQIVKAIKRKPVYSYVFDDQVHFATKFNTNELLRALNRYETKRHLEYKIRVAEREIELENSEITDLQAGLETLETFQPMLESYGWPLDDYPKIKPRKFEPQTVELPKLDKRVLKTEGRFIKLLLVIAKIDVDALEAGDSNEFAKLLKMTEGKIDDGTLSKMLDRWGRRPIKPRSSSS